MSNFLKKILNAEQWLRIFQMTGKMEPAAYVLIGSFLLYTWFVWSYLYSVSSLFPGSLRYLVQQHLDLLHALQERVLKWPRQGVLGDLFLKLTNDEVSVLKKSFVNLELHASVSPLSASKCRTSNQWFSELEKLLRSSLTSSLYR